MFCLKLIYLSNSATWTCSSCSVRNYTVVTILPWLRFSSTMTRRHDVASKYQKIRQRLVTATIGCCFAIVLLQHERISSTTDMCYKLVVVVVVVVVVVHVVVV